MQATLPFLFVMCSPVSGTEGQQPKVFVIGLPRTGTTTLCEAMLRLGFKVAHTAYIEDAFVEAQVLADTPVFNQFESLDTAFPASKFIYLERDLATWLPSIRGLIKRMWPKLMCSHGGFNPHIKQNYKAIFSPLTESSLHQDEHLTRCYLKHQERVSNYFKNRAQDLLSIDIGDELAMVKLRSFIATNLGDTQTGVRADNQKKVEFMHLNKGGKVTAWKDVVHPLKVDSTRSGKVDSKIIFLNQAPQPSI